MKYFFLNYKKSVLYLLLLLFFSDNATGQTQAPDYIPASPGVSSLAKFADIPVGLYTGIPNINIPLYTLDLKKTKLDISISYHSIGNKVNDEASDVGLGWALNAGGIIKREIRGRLDGGSTSTNQDPDISRTTIESVTYMDNVWLNVLDAEPDLFSYNVAGYTGKFFVDYHNNIQLMEKSDIKINRISFGNYYGFEIKTPDGLDYIFGENNYTEETSGACTGYFLTSIKDHLSNVLAQFEYEQEVSGYPVLAGAWAKYLYPSGQSVPILLTYFYPTDTYVVNGSDTYRIKDIIFDCGDVLFKYKTAGREDGNSQANALDTIIIRNNNVTKKKVTFSTSYFLTTGIESVSDALKPRYKRLKLYAVTISSPDNAFNEQYSFVYNTEPLPPKNSFCQDYWGFYNGKVGEQYKNQALGHMIPQITNKSVSAEQWTMDENNVIWLRQRIDKVINLPGADRNADSYYAKADILEKINMPTGGYQRFEYELNNYYDETEYVNKVAGGLRIKNQMIFDGIKEETWTYKYTLPSSSNSSGYLCSKPQNIYFRYKSDGPRIFVPDLITNSNSVTELRTSGGGLVVYSNVEVKKIKTVNGSTTSNGKTLYSYFSFSDSELHIAENEMSYGIKFFPFYLSSFGGVTDYSGLYSPTSVSLYAGEGLQGKLKSIYYYSSESDFTPVRSENYYYSELAKDEISAARVGNYDGLYLMRKYKIRPSFAQLDYKTITENGVTATTQYVYEDIYNSNSKHLQPVSETIDDSRGTRTINYKYSYDFPENTICANMISKNLGLPAMISEEWKDGKLTDVNYNEYNANLLLSKIHKLNVNNPLTASPLTYNNSTGVFNINTDLLSPEIIFDSNDTKGNVLQYHKNNDNNTALIWGYNQTYPVVKIVGIAYNDIQVSIKTNITGRTYTSSSNYADVKVDVDYIKGQLSTLMANTSYMVTIYTYKPVVGGMTSQTDPNGVTTYYEYDSFGRLQCIRDDDGRILKTYEYHYKQ